MADESTLTKMIKSTFFQQMKDVNTCVPGHLTSFDPVTQMSVVQIGIKKKIKNGQEIDASVIIECPTEFNGGSEFMMEHELNPDDEGMIHFSQRCIDGWRETGGIASNPVTRFHDSNDAVFVPGMRSKANAIKSFENEGIRLRNRDASAYIWLKKDGNIHIKGNVILDGDAIISGDAVASGISLVNHGTLPGTFKVGSTPVTGEGGKPT